MDDRAVVLDIGAAIIKAGFAGDVNPLHDCPATVGYPKSWLSDDAKKSRTRFVGENAIAHRGILQMKYPILGGEIHGHEADLETLLFHVYEDLLHTTGSYQKVLVTESFNSGKSRQTLFELLYESLGVPAASMYAPSALALTSAGRWTGIVLDIGESGTRCNAVVDGYLLPDTSQQSTTGGDAVNETLSKHLHYETAWESKTSAEREIVRDIKETLCYVSLPYNEENTRPSATYVLPDGTLLSVRDCLSKAPEILFLSSWEWRGGPGLHDMLREVLETCSADTRRSLFENVVLCGGTSSLQGLRERLSLELGKACPASNKIRVKLVAAEKPSHAIWIGGSIIASLNAALWVSYQEYDEEGLDRLLLRTAAFK